MKKYRSYRGIFYFSIIMFSLVDLAKPQVVLAENYNEIVGEAPVGLDISSYFDVGNFKLAQNEKATDYPFQTNSSSIFTSKADQQHSGRVLNLAKSGESVYSAADDSNSIKLPEVGAAWSKIDDDSANFIDINKKQTVSVWMYFGSGEGQIADNGEGMSLVLQNDPRGSGAMGAGYQGMGALGYDNARYKENKLLFLGSPFGTWTADSGSSPLINSESEIAQTAVANSIALDFNSQINSLISENTYLSPFGTGWTAIQKGNTSESRYKEFTLNSFGTTNSNVTVPDNYPEKNAIFSQNGLGSFPLRLGNSGGMYGVISLTYPGEEYTYKNISLANVALADSSYGSNNIWHYLNSKDNGYATSTFQVGAVNASLINATYKGNELYWHHLTFTWIPAKNGNPAEIHYDYNDKFPDGSKNLGQSRDYTEVTQNIPVDPSVFNNPDRGRVYWGLTGANNGTSQNYSKIAVFESIPALTTAHVKTTLTDKTSGKVITDESNANNASQKTPDSKANLVNYNDELALDYNLAWDYEESKKDWLKIAADINLPTDIKYTSATITYHNDAGSSEAVTIANGTDLSAKKLRYEIASLGSTNDSNGYTSADIVVNGRADNETDHVITEDSQPAVFKGTDAIESTSTPIFKIDVKPQYLQLTVSKSLNFQSINYLATQAYLKRVTPFTLSVTELKEAWTLKASTTELFNGSQSFEGNLIYKKDDQSKPIYLNGEPQEIATGEATNQNSTTNISKDWDDFDGLLLQPNNKKISPAGDYTGNLTWEVDDSVK